MQKTDEEQETRVYPQVSQRSYDEQCQTGEHGLFHSSPIGDRSEHGLRNNFCSVICCDQETNHCHADTDLGGIRGQVNGDDVRAERCDKGDET